MSQLGYMFLACGVAAFCAGIFHLMSHAFFRGLLFLAAGSVIHAVGAEQDMRKMGVLRKKIPWTFWTMTMATFAIAGIPPLAGFFSKDEILWRAYEANGIYWLVGLVTAFITSFYMFRLWFMTFFGEYRGVPDDSHTYDGSRTGVSAPHGHGHSGIHESPKVMLVPLLILAVLSFAGGWVGIHNRFDNFLAPVFESSAIAATTFEGGAATRGGQEGPGVETTLMIISVTAAVLGFLVAFLLYNRKPELPARIAASVHGLYSAVANKYWIDELYAWILVKPLIAISGIVFWRGIDQGVIDGTLDGSADGARELSDEVRHMQSGNLRSYAGWISIGATAVIAYMVWVGRR